MKIRNGFVSNSSSSSFIIRGVKIKKTEFAEKFNVVITDEILSQFDCKETAIMDRAWYAMKDTGLKYEDTRDFFNRDEITNDVIVGIEICDLEDGVPTEIPDVDDDEIRQKLQKYAIAADKLSTFVQYISNDNF